MKKVICIDGNPKIGSICLPEGIPLEAHQSTLFENYLVVEGYYYCDKTNRYAHWHKRRFIPLSEISETEMEREFNSLKELV